MEYIIQDLKTDRANISAGLPPIYRLVPIGFYASLVLALGLNLLFYFNTVTSKAKESLYQHQIASDQSAQTELIAKQATIALESSSAAAISDWLAGARAVQPIGVTVARSVQGKASIAELNLERNPQMTSHLLMTLKVNGGGPDQIEGTLDAIAALQYQPYSAQQQKGEDAVDFSATLIWNDRQ